MTEILDGKILSKAIREKARKRVKDVESPPGLAVILVGNDAASGLYVSLKEKAAREVGLYVEKHVRAEATTEEMVELIRELNFRDDIHGILVQLPLPSGLDTDAVIGAIHPTKDVDGFHPESRRALLAHEPLFVPPVALAIMRLIQASRLPLINKSGVVVGNSEIFAEPILELLRDNDVPATFIKKDSPKLVETLQEADIIVVAVGQAGFLTKEMVKTGAVIIDVGTNKTEDGKVVGDASPALRGHAGFMSPVPGGVGPLTIAYLLMNVIKAKEVHERIREGEEA